MGIVQRTASQISAARNPRAVQTAHLGAVIKLQMDQLSLLLQNYKRTNSRSCCTPQSRASGRFLQGLALAHFSCVYRPRYLFNITGSNLSAFLLLLTWMIWWWGVKTLLTFMQQSIVLFIVTGSKYK